MSDTPKTDALVYGGKAGNSVEVITLARKLERENTELRRDKERLDWLDSVESSKWWHDNGNAIFDIPGRPGELRAAIDTAMEDSKPKEEES